MAYSTSYCHSGKLLDSRNVWNAVICITALSDQADLAFCRHVWYSMPANNFTVQSPISEANRLSASQDIRRTLGNPKALCRIHKNPAPICILSQINPDHALCPPNPQNLLKIHFNIIYPSRLGLQSGLFPSGIPTKILYAPWLSPIRAICPSHLTFRDLITCN